MHALQLCLQALALLPVVAGAAHRVHHIPGYGAPPTGHYSGFVTVDADTDTNLFYYLVESQSADPSNDPLLWWMNGGPGASSMVGLFAENGPLLMASGGGPAGPPRFVNNPYAWNRKANVLYVEFAPGIGYSYCANSSKPTGADGCAQASGDCSPCYASDASVASNNVALLEALLTRDLPEYAGRPLYLAGESYAGVYIPTLANAIVTHPSFVAAGTSLANLHGLWVTDPCTDNGAQFGWLDLGTSSLSLSVCPQLTIET